MLWRFDWRLFGSNPLILILKVLLINPCDDLNTQLGVFLDHKEEDFEEFFQRYENIRLDFEDIEEVFDLVHHTVSGNPIIQR